MSKKFLRNVKEVSQKYERSFTDINKNKYN